MSGVLDSQAASSLETCITGPGTLTFWWKVSCQEFFGSLALLVNGTKVSAISGSVDWQQQTVYLGAGTQVLDWTFTTDIFGPEGPYAGWLDEVSFSPGTTGPILTLQPVSQSQATGADVTFSSAAVGTPPLSYQWLLNGTNILGATGSSLTLTNIQTTNAGGYSVLVSNPAGSAQTTNAALVLGRIAAWGRTIPANITNAVAIAGGLYHMLALQPDGTVLAWGANNTGQTNVPAGLSNVLAVAGGGWFSLALKADGTVVAWGDNSSGQTDVPADLTNAITIAGGFHHGLALRSDGTVTAWGDNTYGQANIPPGLAEVVAIGAGFGYNLALKADGTVTAWGKNSMGTTDVPAGLTNVVAIAGGVDHCMALEANGTLTVWGNYNYGLTNIPVGLTNAVAIAAGQYRFLGLQADGTVTSWGWAPSAPAGLRNMVAIASGGYHGLALQGSGPPALTIPLSSPSWSSNGFSVLVPTQNGRVYRLEHTASLNDPSWVGLPLVPGNGRTRTLSDPSPADAQRFYRVREW